MSPRPKLEHPKTILITGCSMGGIGVELVRQFHDEGHTVYATVRNLNHDYPYVVYEDFAGLYWLPMDVTNQESISKCLELFKEKSGQDTLDILVNNAGIGYSAPLLDADLDKARKVFETNYIGVLAVTQAFAPLVIKARGRVVNISSVAQFTPVPWLGVYNSSKAALSMFSDTLRQELWPFGVKVINVVTGGVESNVVSNMAKDEIGPNSVYAPSKEIIDRKIAGEETLRHRMTREAYGKKVVKHVLKAHPSAQFFAGNQASTLWFFDTFASHTFWDWAFAWMYGLYDLKDKREPFDTAEKERLKQVRREEKEAKKAAAAAQAAREAVEAETSESSQYTTSTAGSGVAETPTRAPRPERLSQPVGRTRVDSIHSTHSNTKSASI